MSLNLNKTSLLMQTTVGTGGAQAICKASMNLPEGKPDLGRLLPSKAEAVVEASGIRVEEGKVSVKGYVRLLTPYVAAYETEGYVGDREPLRFFASLEPGFEVEIPVLDAVPGLLADVEAEVDSFEIEKAGSRSLQLTAIVRLGARVMAPSSLDVVSEISDTEDKVEVAKRTLYTENPIGASSSTFTIRDAFQIPEGRPDIGELLDYTATVIVGPDGLKAGANRISAAGTLDLRIAYVGDLEEKPVIFLAGPQIDFNTVVDLSGATEVCNAKGKGTLESLTLSKVGSRTLQVEAVLKVDAEASSVNGITAVVDIAAKGEDVVDYQKSPLAMESLVGSLYAPSAVAETFAVGAGKPSIDEIIMTMARVRINDSRIVPDKVTISGEVDVFVTYAGLPDDEGQVAAIESAQALGLPFEVSLDMPGAEAGMTLTVGCDVIEAEGLKAGPRAIDVDIKLASNVRVTELVRLDVLSDAAVVTVSAQEGLPSRRITVYVVQPGDTMWKVARRYGKTMARIAETNALVGQDLMPGQKLLIPA